MYVSHNISFLIIGFHIYFYDFAYLFGLIRTMPRRRAVTDMSAQPPVPGRAPPPINVV